MATATATAPAKTAAKAEKVELTEKQVAALKAQRTKEKLAACPFVAAISEVVPFDEKARAGRNRVFITFDAEAQALVTDPEKAHVVAKPAIEAALRKVGYRYDYLGWNPNAGGKGVAGFTMDKQTKGRKNVTINVELTPAPKPETPEPAVVEAAAAEAEVEVDTAVEAADAEVVETTDEVAETEPEVEVQDTPAGPELVSIDEDENAPDES